MLAYEYDANGNKTQLTVTHNGSSIDTAYTYDALNRLASVTDENGITTYAYDAVGNRTSLTHANGTTTVYTYDQLNRLTNLENRHGATVINSFAYTLDPTGRRTQISENTGRVTTYHYDNLYRLLGESIQDAANGNYQASYQYDRVGNRTQQIINGATTQFHYDANDRILQMGGTTYSYDANGNTLNETINGEITRYTYDAKNKLATVQRNGITTLFNYNADGIRTSQTTGSNTTKYIVDQNQPYAQVLIEAANDETISYTVGDDLLSQRKNNVTSFFHYDGFGSTRALTNDAGATTDKWDFEAFGNTINREGTTENNYLFTGEQFDQNLNHYYLRARYYNPANGRFTQQDTWMGRNHDPITLNKYAYANADPLMHVDPSGNSANFSISGQLVTGAIFATLSSVTLNIYNPLKIDNKASEAPNSWLSGREMGVAVLLSMSPRNSVLWNLAIDDKKEIQAVYKLEDELDQTIQELRDRDASEGINLPDPPKRKGWWVCIARTQDLMRSSGGNPRFGWGWGLSKDFQIAKKAAIRMANLMAQAVDSHHAQWACRDPQGNIHRPR